MEFFLLSIIAGDESAPGWVTNENPRRSPSFHLSGYIEVYWGGFY